VREKSRAATQVIEHPQPAYRVAASQNAVLLQEGKPLTFSHIVAEAKQTVAAAEVALPQLFEQIHTAIRADRDPVNVPVPDEDLTGAQLVEHIRAAYARAAENAESGRRLRRYRRAYDVANAKPRDQRTDVDMEILNLNRQRDANLGENGYPTSLPKGTRNPQSDEVAELVDQILADAPPELSRAERQAAHAERQRREARERLEAEQERITTQLQELEA
jgi:hypothetical protein